MWQYDFPVLPHTEINEVGDRRLVEREGIQMHVLACMFGRGQMYVYGFAHNREAYFFPTWVLLVCSPKQMAIKNIVAANNQGA